MASASLVGANGVGGAGRGGPRAGLVQGSGMSETLPYPEDDAGGLMISRLPARVGSARALERAVLSGRWPLLRKADISPADEVSKTWLVGLG
jgi:hypothetical protein